MDSDIQLVCFDLGRVLVRICDGWGHACQVAGVRPAREPDVAETAALHGLVCQVEVGQIEPAEFFRQAAPEMGLRPQDVEEVWNSYTRGTFPGAPELLDELRAAGVATACLSNTNSV